MRRKKGGTVRNQTKSDTFKPKINKNQNYYIPTELSLYNNVIFS